MNREQRIRFNKKKFRHELRKRRKQKGQSQRITHGKNKGDWTPNILARFRPAKEAK